MDLVPPQRWVAVCLDPHASHGVVKDLIVLDEAQTWQGNVITKVVKRADSSSESSVLTDLVQVSIVTWI